MLPVLTLSLLLLLLFSYLVRIHLQIRKWTEELEETETGSNLRLTLSVRTPGFKRLCRAFNTRLAKEQKAYAKQQAAGKELKYTISCISHDIRTPLTGACGYVELLKRSLGYTTTHAHQDSGPQRIRHANDPQKAEYYLNIIQNRLKDLETLLDELFLYTKVTQEEYELHLTSIAPYPILCDLLASFYDRIAYAGLLLDLQYPQESLLVYGNEEGIRRVFSNLLKNALTYGEQTLSIVQEGASLTFANFVPTGIQIDTERLFERFYKADTARHSTGSGLGLSIVEHLMQKMGGTVSARLSENILKITISFCQTPAQILPEEEAPPKQ